MIKDKVLIIYITTNLINGKIYVGRHQQKEGYGPDEFDGYLGSGSDFKKAKKEFGRKNFKRETLEYCTSRLGQREHYWVDILHATNPKIGYNIREGGDGGLTEYSDETRRKISESKIGKYIGENNPNYGNGDKIKGDKNPNYRNYWTEEQKEKARQLNLGRHPSDETIRKLSIANSGENAPFLGHHHTEKTKRLIGEINKGREPPNKGVPMSEAQKKLLRELAIDRPEVSAETRQKMSIAGKGRIFTEEHKKNISESKKGEKHPYYGKHLSVEHRRKIGESLKGTHTFQPTKFIYCIEKDDIKYITDNMRIFCNNHKDLKFNHCVATKAARINRIYKGWKISRVEKVK